MDSLREIQLYELEMLKDVVKVCEDNNIRYFISSGTLLGAVRHGGFIPWDDDIDIQMPLKDYKKFLKIGQKALGEKYFVQNYKTDPDYCLMWTHIRINNTTSMPVKLAKYNIHFGICMDVFPFVGYSDDPKKQEKQNNALQKNWMWLSDKYLKALGENFGRKRKLIFLIPRWIRRLMCRINEHNYMIDTDKYDNITTVCGRLIGCHPKNIIDDVTKIEFENNKFTTFACYKEYLSQIYGDYMTPPPENERGGHNDTQSEIIFDTKKSYLEYQKELLSEAQEI